MVQANHLLQIEFSSRDRKLTLCTGLVVLLIGLGMLGNNWARDTYAPLAIMSGLFLVCLAGLGVLKRLRN